MNLPVVPPFPPMEALVQEVIPPGPGWQYEPKWDGFRCVAFRDGSEVYLQSKAGQPLARYFPELVSALLSFKASRFVLDGEIAVEVNGSFSFDDLLQRIHPAESRVRKLAAQFPAVYIVFDLLVNAKGRSLVNAPLPQRRRELEDFASRYLLQNQRVRLSPATTDFTQAKTWFSTVGDNLDGIVAKRLDLPYKTGERDGMVKIKRLRTADCVVGGFRYAEKSRVVGSLLLGCTTIQVCLTMSAFVPVSQLGIENGSPKNSSRSSSLLVSPAMPQAGRAAGAPNARWSGSLCARSWWSRSVMITSLAAGSATARACFAGALIKTQASAASSKCSKPRLCLRQCQSPPDRV